MVATLCFRDVYKRQLKEEGYKPSEEFIKGIVKEHDLDESQTHEVIQLFGTKPEEQGEHERQAARLLDAAQTDNFHVIQELSLIHIS